MIRFAICMMLANSDELPEKLDKHGPNSSPHYTKASLVKFLEKRRIIEDHFSISSSVKPSSAPKTPATAPKGVAQSWMGNVPADGVRGRKIRFGPSLAGSGGTRTETRGKKAAGDCGLSGCVSRLIAKAKTRNGASASSRPRFKYRKPPSGAFGTKKSIHWSGCRRSRRPVHYSRFDRWLNQ